MQYLFHFAGRKVRVSKEYFCSALDISHQWIKYFYKVENNQTAGFLQLSHWRKHVEKVLGDESKEGVREHIWHYRELNHTTAAAQHLLNV